MKISYKQIESFCNDLHATVKNMKELLENIDIEASNLQNKDKWSGEAAEFYVSKLKSMTRNFDEIFRELENSILYMANCAEGYRAIDQTIIKEICDNLNISQPNLSTSSIFNGV